MEGTPLTRQKLPVGKRQCRICGDELPEQLKRKQGPRPQRCEECTSLGRTRPIRPCVVCGKVSKHKHVVSLCSDECRQIRMKQHIDKSWAKQTSFPHVCVECGAWFYGMKQSKTCSPKCRSTFNARNRGLVLKKEVRCTCLRCGKEYQPKELNRDTCCSRACWYRLVKSKGKATDRAKAAIKREAKKRHCIVCNAPFTANRTAVICSDKCRKQHACKKAREREEKAPDKQCACIVCGVAFSAPYGDKQIRFCSKACKKLRHLQLERDRRKARGPDTHRARARRNGVRYEPIDREEILKRDNYKCQICGRKTRRRKDGKVDGKHPSLDHIVPIALGGSHTKENVQCACFRCNTIKGHTGKGDQMLLYG